MAGKVHRLPVVGVMGSGSTEELHLASPLGQWLAGQPCHLICGGGGGTMLAVAKSFVNAEPPGGRKGLAIGVLPGIPSDDDSWGSREATATVSDATNVTSPLAAVPPPGYPNSYVELPIYTHLPTSGAQGQELMSRNHIIILTSDVVVALPGGPGTASEVALAMKYGKPVLLFLGESGGIAGLDDATAARAPRARTIEEVAEFVGPRIAGRLK